MAALGAVAHLPAAAGKVLRRYPRSGFDLARAGNILSPPIISRFGVHAADGSASTAARAASANDRFAAAILGNRMPGLGRDC